MGWTIWFVVTAWASRLAAAQLASDDPVAVEVTRLERNTWVLYGRHDVAGLAAITADDFNDIYPDGDVVDKAGYLRDVPEVTLKEHTLDRFHVFKISHTTVVVTYEAKARGSTPRAGEISTHVAVTSVWDKRPEGWRNVFYRENVLAMEKLGKAQ